jgi:hypothetical protein
MTGELAGIDRDKGDQKMEMDGQGYFLINSPV